MSEEISKITSQMRKGILEYAILTIISKGDVYASDILETLKKNSLIVVEGTLYPLLSRLKTEGMLAYSWVESTSGPPRKYYRLTENGKDLLKLMDITWKELVQAISGITQ